jgi:hypothetical protein
MERREIKFDATRNAAAAVILPIAGMLGGLAIGAFRARGPAGVAELAPLLCAIKWGITGFFAGLALVVLLALQLRRQDVISIRRLMVLVLVAALIAWFFGRIFSGVIGYEGF